MTQCYEISKWSRGPRTWSSRREGFLLVSQLVPATSAAMNFSATTMEATATMETYGAVKSSAWLESMSIGFVEFAEAMAVAIAIVSAIEKRGTINREGRVEAPAEWAIENPIPRNEGVGA
jgi:hypothetical protein